jgi:dual-specificity kinase
MNSDEVIRQCGLGTFGKVFLARDRKRDEQVAIKVVRSIERYIDSAKIEADILQV